MLINNQCIKLVNAFFDIEVEAFTNNKPSSLFERQVALKKLKIEVLSFIKERPDAMFTIKNTTAKGDCSNSITIKPYDSQTRRKYEITLANDCSTFTAITRD